MAESRTSKRWLKRILLTLAAVLVVVAGVGAAYAFSLAQTFDNATETIDEVFPDETTRPTVPTPTPDGSGAEPRPPQNILLLGSDTRGSGESLQEAGGRADAILVVHVPADRKNIQVMSIMRDNWVEIPGHGRAKVNAALAYGGVPLMVQT